MNKNLKSKYLFLLLFILSLLSASCKRSIINFYDFPKDYKIAYFEELGVKNIPSVNDLFGKHASYNNEFMGVPSYVVINSYTSTKDTFSAEILLRVKETEYDIFRLNIKFMADEDTQRTYIRYVKAESLLSNQYLEEQSDGLAEDDEKVFDLFLRYMNYIWK